MKNTVTYFNDIEQRSAEWFSHKLATIGGSEFKNIIDHKTGLLKTDYNKDGSLKSKTPVLTAISKIISELETGMSEDLDGFVSEAMEWGIDTEIEVIDLVKTKDSFQTGGVKNSRFKYCWLSPDLLDLIKGTEIKCPNSKTFAKWVMIDNIKKGGFIPDEHICQVMGYFVMIPTLETVDFVYYDPRFKTKKKHKTTVTRFENKAFIHNMGDALEVFCNMVDEKIKLFK